MATTVNSLETQVRRVLQESAQLSTPGAPTVTPQGTSGAATWTYKIVAITGTGTTEASAAGSTATGNATLDGTNYNRLTWTAVTNAIGYWIYRTASGGTPATTGRIAVLGAVTTYDDQGGAGDSATAPTTNTSGLTSPFWSSAELLDWMNHAFKDLWRSIIDLHQDHFQTVDTTNVSLSASTASLSGVPSDVFRVLLIEPTNTTSTGSYKDLEFVPKDYNSPAFITARRIGDQDPNTGGVIYYAISQAGPPVGTVTVHVAPTLSSALSAGGIRFVYIPMLAAVAAGGNNPIPGESDNAVIAWTIAYALSKDRDDRMPDPSWISIYATEKQAMLTALTPRQEQEPEVVEALFGSWW